jgi:hypothetical protein
MKVSKWLPRATLVGMAELLFINNYYYSRERGGHFVNG